MPRKKRAAYIYQRPGSKVGWYAWISRDERHISLQTEDEGEAQRKLVEMLDDRRLRALAPNEKSVNDVFIECDARSSANHTAGYAKDVFYNARRIMKWLESKNVFSTKMFSRQLAEDYKAFRLADGVGASRINRELDTWKKATKIAVEWQCCHEDTLKVFVKMRETKPQPHQHGLVKETLNAFMAAEDSIGYRALFRVEVGTGMRDDEIRHMAESDIQEPWIVVSPKPPGFCKCHPKGWTTKGYRYRQIPVSKDTVEAARLFLSLRPGLRLDRKAIWVRIGSACDKARVPRFSMQDLRRAWASHMLAAGHKIEKISKWLGHADILTTMRYLRIVEIEAPAPESLPF